MTKYECGKIDQFPIIKQHCYSKKNLSVVFIVPGVNQGLLCSVTNCDFYFFSKGSTLFLQEHRVIYNVYISVYNLIYLQHICKYKILEYINITFISGSLKKLFLQNGRIL